MTGRIQLERYNLGAPSVLCWSKRNRKKNNTNARHDYGPRCIGPRSKVMLTALT
jgi:hypothetical protein